MNSYQYSYIRLKWILAEEVFQLQLKVISFLNETTAYR